MYNQLKNRITADNKLMTPKLEGNLAMTFSKVCSGLNENALRFLLPLWMSATSGVALRLCFGAAAFWLVGLFTRKSATKVSWKQRGILFGLGAIVIYGYMFALLKGLSYTTPISSAMFISLEPVMVFVICLLMGTEKATRMKSLGISLGFAGAMVCIFTQKHSDIASDPMLGDLFCAASMVLYSLYLIFSAKLLKGIDMVTVSKWSFLGGAVSAVIVTMFTGWDAPVLHQSIFSLPMLALLFVLIFPSTISYFLVDVGLKRLSTTVVALYGYVILVVAMVVSYITGQDRFDWWQMLAVIMIVASVYFTELAEAKTTPAPAK